MSDDTSQNIFLLYLSDFDMPCDNRPVGGLQMKIGYYSAKSPFVRAAMGRQKLKSYYLMQKCTCHNHDILISQNLYLDKLRK